LVVFSVHPKWQHNTYQSAPFLWFVNFGEWVTPPNPAKYRKSLRVYCDNHVKKIIKTLKLAKSLTTRRAATPAVNFFPSRSRSCKNMYIVSYSHIFVLLIEARKFDWIFANFRKKNSLKTLLIRKYSRTVTLFCEWVLYF